MKKIDDTIKEMQNYLKDLDKDFNAKVDKLSDEAKIKAEELLNNTKKTINNSIKKVSDAVEGIKNDERLDDFLDEIKARSKEAVEYTKAKISTIDKDGDGKILDDLHDDIMNEFNKLKENEVYKKTSVFIKDVGSKINEYLQKPEVKAKIKKAKKTTVNLAEKGVKGLKKVLDTDEEPKKASATKKTAAKKTTTTKKAATKKPAAKKSK